MINYKIYEAYPEKKILAQGTTLKEACLNWQDERWENDNLYEAYKKSKFYNEELDFDECDEMYNQFIDSLTGEEMFTIMSFDKYVKWEWC